MPVIHACPQHRDLDGIEADRRTPPPRHPQAVGPEFTVVAEWWTDGGAKYHTLACSCCRWEVEPDIGELALADDLERDEGLRE